MEEDTEVGVDGLLDGEPGRSVALPLREEARPMKESLRRRPMPVLPASVEERGDLVPGLE